MADLIGQSLGRYHILEKLGEGGMAIIYKAYDTLLEREVALKIIRKGAFPPDHVERILKRFEREAKALARLSHPNIVKLHDYGEHEGSPYLVMEFLPSGTLKQKMGKPIPWQEGIRILLPIVEALDYAHSQNMVHRDVKPSNILLTQRGQPMLTDFGIAKVLDLEETQELTGTSAAVGTPEYMAPEQATARTVDHRADIYALAVVLYEMVTGRKPFIADTPMAVLIKHATEPLPRPRQLVPNLPDGLEKILLKALAKNPVDRYQSMGEMGAAFEKIMKGQEKSPVVREKAKRQPDPTSIQKRTLVESASAIKSVLPKVMPFFGIAGIIGIVLLLVWMGSKIIPQVPPAMPALEASATSYQVATISSTSLPLLPMETQSPTTIEPATHTSTTNPPGSIQISAIDNAKMVLVPSSNGIDSFWIDQTAVTDSMFEKFVQSTNYITDAEKNGVGFVWTFLGNLPATQFPGQTGMAYEWKLRDVNWKDPARDETHTGNEVLQVSWNDANAYCQWAGRRLIKRAEWESAYKPGSSIAYYNNSYHSGGLGEWAEDKTIGTYRAVLGYQDVTWGGIHLLFDERGFIEYRSANLLTFRCALSVVSNSESIPREAVTPEPLTASLPTEIADAKGVPMVPVPATGDIAGVGSLAGYYVDKYEVTNALYKSCVDADICIAPREKRSHTRSSYYDDPEFGNYPVIYVDWSQAQAYCNWREAGLPTDAQWEKAAQGTDGRIYPWGDDIDCSRANYFGCQGDTTAVGSYQGGVSPYGVYDMAGNVWEWVDSDSGDSLKYVRGGAWNSFKVSLRVDYKSRNNTDFDSSTFFYIGFRCAKNMVP